MVHKPLILEIKGNSLDDGPGIRTVIFFKGCPLSCVWCHNPESKRTDVEISYDPKQCIACDTCIETCPYNAISKENPFFIDRSKCSLCFLCVKTCPSGALTRVGKDMTIDEIVNTVLKDKPFFETSGGGVTLSGGEPTLYMEFTSYLLKALKENGIHTLMETCGYFNPDRFIELIYPYLDTIYYDIKLFDETEHKEYCGVSNKNILKNFVKLTKLANKNDKIDIVPRTPLIPGITDTESNMHAIAHFLKASGSEKAQLLPYNPLWHEKNLKIGKDSPYSKKTGLTEFMDAKKIEKCKDVFRQIGIGV